MIFFERFSNILKFYIFIPITNTIWDPLSNTQLILSQSERILLLHISRYIFSINLPPTIFQSYIPPILHLFIHYFLLWFWDQWINFRKFSMWEISAITGIRTHDLFHTGEMLYLLSYFFYNIDAKKLRAVSNLSILTLKQR